MKEQKQKTWIDKINVSAYIADQVSEHLVGTNHSKTHHRIAGASIIMVGVFVAEEIHIAGVPVVHFICLAVGYVLHGIGAIPFIKSYETEHKKDEEEMAPKTENQEVEEPVS